MPAESTLQSRTPPAPPIEVHAPQAVTPAPCVPDLSPPIARATSTHVEIDSRRILAFAGCDYLALAHHPAVLAAAQRAIGRFGLSTTASRVTTGNTAAHDELERDLARLLAQPAAIVVPDGFMANLALAQSLVARRHAGPPIDTALIDARAHRSIHDSAKAVGMTVNLYDHRDPASAAARLRAIGPRPVAIMTDGVFTADGAVAPAADLLAILRTPDDALVIDDCHGVGVLGDARGTCHAQHVSDPRLIITTTLAKGLGCYGGAIAASGAAIADIRHAATAFICTTPIPPAVAAAASAAIHVAEHDAARRERLARNAALLREAIASLGVALVNAPTPIAAFALGTPPDVPAMQRIHTALLDRGILAPLIRYPAGPADRFFRLTVNADHTPEHVGVLRDALAEVARATI
ncbi:MAG: aminotransferase class I/II-fold pyridoxal phosphate-dependent enzyme [Phycisphaerales bacterium]|nr:aminotransferase class I/II-fold pyridoxal phosphate-dependent enzyme [Phycisphaerales bacterium]